MHQILTSMFDVPQIHDLDELMNESSHLTHLKSYTSPNKMNHFLCMKINMKTQCHLQEWQLYLLPVVSGAEKAGSVALHASHRASFNGFPFPSLSTDKNTIRYHEIIKQCCTVYLKLCTVNLPSTLPSGHWHLPFALTPPGQRMHSYPS